MKISVIVTVRNEEASIAGLLDSLRMQTRPPDEIVICDGGSTDRTGEIINQYMRQGLPLHLMTAPGANISRGRNQAIAATTGEIVAATDAGVRLGLDWLERLVAPFGTATPADVASGFFVPDAHGVFETAMGATVLP